MNATFDVDRALSFINCQLRPSSPIRGHELTEVRGITISRQSGCGAHFFAANLAGGLQAHSPPGERPWTVFDRGLVEAVLQDHHLPARLASFMPEDRVGMLNDIIEDLCSLHPPMESLVRRTSETILHLAELGHAIIVGRGAHIITARLPGMLHIRLIGSVEVRLTHMLQIDHLERKDAVLRMEREDGGRRRYLKRYFGKDIDDPLQYHFVINTDWVSLEEAAHMICMFAQSPAVTHATHVG